MRFGKRLVEVTQRSRANEPYISYKELKHVLSKLAALLGEGGGLGGETEQDGSSGGEGGPAQRPAAQSISSRGAGAGPAAPVAGAAGLDGGACASASSSAAAYGAGSTATAPSRLETHQQEFFRRVDADVAAARMYVLGVVSGLEAQVGEWQSTAIRAGLLFTPEQLEDVSAQLPFQMESQQALVDWLMSLQPVVRSQEVRRTLVQKYSNIASSLNALLQYIEVNLTAIRKIFKKFEKKVPAALHVKNVRDYKAHHDFFMPSMQHILATAVQMQRLIVSFVAPVMGAEAAALAVPISQIGPESLALLSWLRGPAALDDVLGGVPVARIDVYAKPSLEISSTGATGTGGSGAVGGLGSGSPGHGDGVSPGVAWKLAVVGSSGPAAGSASDGLACRRAAAASGVKSGSGGGAWPATALGALDLFQGPPGPGQLGGSGHGSGAGAFAPGWPGQPGGMEGSGPIPDVASRKTKSGGGDGASGQASEDLEASGTAPGSKGGRRRGGRNNRGSGRGARRGSGGASEGMHEAAPALGQPASAWCSMLPSFAPADRRSCRAFPSAAV